MKLVKPDLYLRLSWMDLPEVEEIVIPGGPACLQGKRLMFVSDVHLRRQVSNDKLQALAALLKAQKADLALLGGDYAETAEDAERFFQAISGLQVPMGCYGVMGNNDSECFPDANALRALMRENGVRLLDNEAVHLDCGLEIGGCGDYKHGEPRTKDIFSTSDYRILLSHFPIKPECEVELMLSGHTHGGQFNIFGVTPYIIGFERRYRIEGISGLGQMDGAWLLVSKGIGVSKLPLRIGARPQIHLVKFTG